MLNLYPEYVARNYMLMIAVASLGTMQAAASVAGLRGLQLGGKLWSRRLAYSVLAVTWVGGAAWFLAASPDFISPGLAGSELIAMFVVGASLAFGASVLGGSLCRGGAGWEPALGQNELPGGCTYSLSVPCERPAGLAILVEDPDLPPTDSAPVAEAVLRHSFACARLTWPRSGPAYPDALAIVPSTIAGLGEALPWTQPLVLVGLGLGGDLVLRVARDDPRVSLACAVGPALGPCGLLDGLLLLREMSVPRACAWRRRWDRRAWLRGLRSAEALAGLEGRAAVLVAEGGSFTEPCMCDSGDGPRGVTASVRASHRDLIRTHAPAFVERCLATLREKAVAGA